MPPGGGGGVSPGSFFFTSSPFTGLRRPKMSTSPLGDAVYHRTAAEALDDASLHALFDAARTWVRSHDREALGC